MIHTLENDQLRVKIADHGAELSEIYLPYGHGPAGIG